MKHRKEHRKFGRVRKQRRWLIRSLISNLVLRGKIQTTEAKAKELKNMMDRIVNKAKQTQDKKRGLTATRYLTRILDKPALKEANKKEFVEKFSTRKSGYTRVTKLNPRSSDGAKIAIIELIKDSKK